MTKLNVQRQEQVNSNDLFLQDIYDGLSQRQKTLPCKYFYDERGSELFDQICETPEYYHTRTEMQILDQVMPEIADLLGPEADILEFGSGAGKKIKKLIEGLERPRSYCPIDISEEILLASAEKLKQAYPGLDVYPIVADYHSPIVLPEEFSVKGAHRKLVFFPGSTISNFDTAEAMHFLKHIRGLLSRGDALLIGVDLIKPVDRLLAAYDDAAGVTAAFNKNILARIRSTYETNLDPESFAHEARYDSDKHRIEMHLVSQVAQRIEIAERQFDFAKDESIHTENSYKYSVENFRLMAMNAGFECQRCFTDDAQLFSVHYLTAD